MNENYSLKLVSKNNDYIWIILENNTKQIIAKYFFEEDGINHCNILNSGAGFNGFTPRFFLQSSSIHQNINKKFNLEVY